MADPLTIGLSIAGSIIPAAFVYLQSNKANRLAQEKIDQEAFKAAKEFYSDTLDEVRNELTIARTDKKAAEADLKEAVKELKESRTERDFLSMRVTMLERENRDLEARVKHLEDKLRSLGADLPPPEEKKQNE